MYWVYNLPNWLFELLTVFCFVAFSVAGVLLTRRWVRRIHVLHSHNDIVGFYLAAITVLYGVTLGLLAIGAWTIYTETEAKVAQEAAALYTLYRSAGNLPEPSRSLLQADRARLCSQCHRYRMAGAAAWNSRQSRIAQLWINSKRIFKHLCRSQKRKRC